MRAMPSFKVEGLDELIEDIERMEAGLEPVFEEMLDIGAEEVVNAWKEAITEHGHIDTGQMLAKVKSAKRKVSGGSDKRYAVIYPRGKDKRGIRHASKAFMRHYGTSKKAGTHFVDTAEEKGSKAAFEKVSKRWESFITEGK